MMQFMVQERGGNSRAHSEFSRTVSAASSRDSPTNAESSWREVSVSFEALFAERMNHVNAMAGTALTIFCFCILVCAPAGENRGIEFGKVASHQPFQETGGASPLLKKEPAQCSRLREAQWTEF